jgi:hypothetical protein
MRAKADYPSVVVAFGGFEFVKNEWRDVPAGFENQAAQHPYLEIEPEPKPEPVEPAKPKRAPRKRTPRKRAVKKDVTK